MLKLQTLYTSLPKELKEKLLKGYTKQWEDKLILLGMEGDSSSIKEIAQEAQIEVGCKKCYERGYTGKRPDGRALLCTCVYKALKDRKTKLNINWSE